MKTTENLKKADEKMESKKEIIEHRYDDRILKLIKMKFAGFKYKLFSKEYKAEFVADEVNAPLPVYDDVECVKNGRYIRCQREGKDEFYSWFVPAKEKNKPLLVVLPGYEARLRSCPDVSDKYSMIFISPLGYSPPRGLDISKAPGNSTWPVLPNTLFGFAGGYSDWIMDAITVIKFIEDENLADADKLIFSGTSQGGAMALILASYYGSERCVAVCADLPFLIGYSTHKLNDVIYSFPPPPQIRFRPSEAKKRLSLVDPEWHVSRLDMPVLITSSDIDDECPEKDISNLYERIPETTTKTYIKYSGRAHGYSSEFFADMMNFLDRIEEDEYFDKSKNT